MILIVGLGNPGKRYADTPHNAGFHVCDRLALRHHMGEESRKFQGTFRRGRIHRQDVGVLKPQTYMNLSGDSVAEAVRYLPVEPHDIFLVYDDMDVLAGKLRIRKSGGHGGHNGIRSVIECLGTSDFPRLRVGVGRPPQAKGATGHLLSRVRADERERFEATVDRAVEAVEVFLREGLETAMNRFNGLPAIGEPPGEPEEEGDQ